MPRMVLKLGPGVKSTLRRMRRKTRDKGLATRCQIVLLSGKQRTAKVIAEALGCSPSWVYQVRRRFRVWGFAGLIDRREDNGQVKLDEQFGRALRSRRSESTTIRLLATDLDAGTVGGSAGRANRDEGASSHHEPGLAEDWCSAWTTASNGQLPLVETVQTTAFAVDSPSVEESAVQRNRLLRGRSGYPPESSGSTLLFSNRSSMQHLRLFQRYCL